MLGALISSAIGGARYLTADMQLLGDPNCFSRFQLVPSRTVGGARKIGDAALAGSALGAFCGFLCRPFRVHDFMLGRHNMQNYLRRVLTLRGDNKLFARWTDALRKDYACDDLGNRLPQARIGDPASYYLPVIPIMASVAVAPLPAWPAGALDLNALTTSTDKRFEKVMHGLLNAMSIPFLLRPVFSLLIDFGLSNKIASVAIERLGRELAAKQLR